MHRRDFLLLTAAVSLAAPLVAHADPIAYTPGLVEERLAAGETLFIDFKASWCTTCKAQERVINALRTENPAYDKEITFVQVDWDTYKDDMLTVEMAIPRRSTLVVVKGDKELGRIVAGTAKAEIKALLDTALTAASS
jgi:thiol:disulfide interchange protein